MSRGCVCFPNNPYNNVNIDTHNNDGRNKTERSIEGLADRGKDHEKPTKAREEPAKELKSKQKHTNSPTAQTASLELLGSPSVVGRVESRCRNKAH